MFLLFNFVWFLLFCIFLSFIYFISIAFINWLICGSYVLHFYLIVFWGFLCTKKKLAQQTSLEIDNRFFEAYKKARFSFTINKSVTRWWKEHIFTLFFYLQSLQYIYFTLTVFFQHTYFLVNAQRFAIITFIRITSINNSLIILSFCNKWPIPKCKIYIYIVNLFTCGTVIVENSTNNYVSRCYTFFVFVLIQPCKRKTNIN